jgi:hypothetical protein
MAGVAEQHDATLIPAIVTFAIEDRPHADIIDCFENAPQIGMEAGK